MTDNAPAHLLPSELGTKDYWETFYARTLAHLSTKQSSSTPAQSHSQTPTNNDNDGDEEEEDADDDSDPGTSWFAEHNAPQKVLDFMTSDEFPLAPVHTLPASSKSKSRRIHILPDQPSILDLGTGNGSMLALLRKRGGFRGCMVGIDYSGASVELARALQVQGARGHSAYLSDSDIEEDDEEEDQEATQTQIRFEEWDILNTTDPLSDHSSGGDLDWFPYSAGGFDIVLDKGTFDAISLSDEIDGSNGSGGGRRVCERYPIIARRCVRKGGFLVVTSCNWTEEELVKWFTSPTSPITGSDGDGDGNGEGEREGDRLVVWGRVEYPRFRFGGKEGQGVCTVCFQRS